MSEIEEQVDEALGAFVEKHGAVSHINDLEELRVEYVDKQKKWTHDEWPRYILGRLETVGVTIVDCDKCDADHCKSKAEYEEMQKNITSTTKMYQASIVKPGFLGRVTCETHGSIFIHPLRYIKLMVNAILNGARAHGERMAKRNKADRSIADFFIGVGMQLSFRLPWLPLQFVVYAIYRAMVANYINKKFAAPVIAGDK